MLTSNADCEADLVFFAAAEEDDAAAPEEEDDDPHFTAPFDEAPKFFLESPPIP